VVATVNPQILVLGGTLGRLPLVVSQVDRQLRLTAMEWATKDLSVIASRRGDEAISAGLTAMVAAHVFDPAAIDALVDAG
jgi:hypothetical protein